MKLKLFTALLFISLTGCTQTVMHPPGNFKFTAVPQTIKTNLIAEWDFLPGYGQWAFNRAGGNFINTNLVGFSEQDFNGYGNFAPAISTAQSTITTQFANNRNSLPIAARLVTSSGAAHDVGTGYIPGIRYNFTLPAGTYTVSVDVKSNTGSSQSVRMESPINTVSGDITVTTSWNRISYTITSAGSSQAIEFLENGSGGTALDILFDGVKIEAGNSASAYTSPAFDFFFGMSALTESLDPIWLPGKGLSLLDQGANAYSSTGASVTNFTVYTVGKLTTNTSEQSYFLSEDYSANKFSVIWGDSIANGFTPSFKFSTHTITSKVADLADNKTHLITGTYDGTYMKFYVDTVLLDSYNLGSISPLDVRRLMLGAQSLVGNVSFNGEIYYASMYGSAHSQAQINGTFMVLQQQLGIRGITMTGVTKFVLFDGDSISDVLSNGLFPKLAMRSLPAASRTLGNDLAVIGSKVSDLVLRAGAVDSMYDSKRSKNILSIFIGANDLTGGSISAATFVASLKSYCLARKATGWKIVLCTLLPNVNSGFNTRRNAANTLIYADNSFYDALADFASDATMGVDAAASNATLYPDGVHPSATGHALIAPYVKTAILSLL